MQVMESEAAQEAAAQQAQFEEEAAAKEAEKAAAKKAKKQRQKAKKQQEQQQQLEQLQKQQQDDERAQQHVQPSATDEANGGVLQQLPLLQQQASKESPDPHNRTQKTKKLKQQPAAEVQVAKTEDLPGSTADAHQSDSFQKKSHLRLDEHQKSGPEQQQQQQQAGARLAGQGDQAGSVAEVQQDSKLEELQLELDEQRGHQTPGAQQQQKPGPKREQQQQKQKLGPQQQQQKLEQQQQQQKPEPKQQHWHQQQQQQQQALGSQQQLLLIHKEQQQLVSGHRGQQRPGRSQQLDSTSGCPDASKQHQPERASAQAMPAAPSCESASQPVLSAEGVLTQAQPACRSSQGRQAIVYLLSCPLTKVTSMLTTPAFRV